MGTDKENWVTARRRRGWCLRKRAGWSNVELKLQQGGRHSREESVSYVVEPISALRRGEDRVELTLYRLFQVPRFWFHKDGGRFITDHEQIVRGRIFLGRRAPVIHGEGGGCGREGKSALALHI